MRPAFHGEVELCVEAGKLSVETAHATANELDEMCEEFNYFADRILTKAEIGLDSRHGLRGTETIEPFHVAAEGCGVPCCIGSP